MGNSQTEAVTTRNGSISAAGIVSEFARAKTITLTAVPSTDQKSCFQCNIGDIPTGSKLLSAANLLRLYLCFVLSLEMHWSLLSAEVEGDVQNSNKWNEKISIIDIGDKLHHHKGKGTLKSPVRKVAE